MRAVIFCRDAEKNFHDGPSCNRAIAGPQSIYSRSFSENKTSVLR